MTSASLALIAVYLLVVLLCVKPMGLYISQRDGRSPDLAAARRRAR